MQTINRKQFVLAGILLGFLALWITAVLLPRSPLQQRVPTRDSDVFLYLGQQILEGQVPYRDVWDHKGPGVYYLNALGLWLGGGSRWGVWWLQWLSLAGAALLGYAALSQAFGHRPAVFASLAWLASLGFVLGGGNFTEEYALLFQFAAVYLFWKSQKSSRPFGYVFMIGVTLAAVFWLKLNMIGVQLSITVVAVASLLFSPHRRQALTWITALLAGVMAVTIPLLGYFAWSGALNEFVDAVFRYNIIYATSTLEDKAKSALGGLQILAQSGIAFAAVTAWIIGGLALFSRPRQTQAHTSLLHVALVGLPVELLLASAPGRAYNHYYLTWLPIFAILTARLAFDFWNAFAPAETTFLQRKIELKTVWSAALLIAIALPAQKETLNSMVKLSQTNGSATPAVVKRIWKYTDPDDYLLMWGAETSYNFLADRRAPSRFVYQYPLYTCGYVTDAMIAEFLDDIARRKPLIIDTSATNDYIPPLDADARKKWDNQAFAGEATENCGLSPRMADVFAFIDTYYRVAEVIQSRQWVIYRHVDAP
jgi:hypothetical protein